MAKFCIEKLQEILNSHSKWLIGKGGKRADLSDADLSDADLCNVNLSHANLCDANLNRANLRNAKLSGARLRGANLSNAYLFDADLRYTDMVGANLSNAYLCDAHLSGADLSKRIVQVGPIGSRKSYTSYNVDDDIVQCGCWNDYNGGTLEEFKKRIDEVYPSGQYRDEYLAAIAMFKLMRKTKEKEEI